jgi:hypothetical protein
MTASPPEPPDGRAHPAPGAPPPPPPGPWASDNLPPYPAGAAPQQVEPPPSIVTAVRLMWVGAGLTILGVLIGLTQIDSIRDQIEEDQPSLTAGEVDSAVTVGVAFSVLFGLVAVGLWLWMASANRRGKSWARIVATVLAGLNLLAITVGLAVNPTTGLSTVMSVVTLVLAVAILVLLYRRESSEYYAGRSRTW